MYVLLLFWDDKSGVISVGTLKGTCKWSSDNKDTERNQLRTVTWMYTHSWITSSVLHPTDP